MSEKSTVEEAHDQGQTVQSPSTPQTIRPSSIPLLLASLALLLAAFSLASTLISSKNMGARQPLDNIQGKLSAIEKRVDQVESSIAANRRDLVQAELQKMLLGLRELSQLGDHETVSEIAKAEAILQKLSSRETKVRAKVDLKSAEQAVKPETVHAPAPSEAAQEEESVTQDSPAMQTSEKSSQDKTETQPAPATSEEETTPQNEAAPTDASKANSETVSATVDEKTGSEKPADTSTPAHEEPEASQTKDPAN